MYAGVALGLAVGAVARLYLAGWQIFLLLVGVVLWIRRAKGATGNKMTATKEEVARAKMVPLKAKGVFSGLRVLEIANTVAAPMVARFLADLGAGATDAKIASFCLFFRTHRIFGRGDQD